MSNFLKIVVCLIVVYIFIFFTPNIYNLVFAIENDVWNEIVTTLNKETESYVSYGLFVDQIKNLDSDSIINQYKIKSVSWKTNFEQGKLVYKKYTNSSDEYLREVASEAYNASEMSLNAIDKYDIVFSGELNEEEVEATILSGDTLFLEASKKHYNAVDLYNEYSGYNSQQSALGILFICLFFSIVFTIILWFKSRTSSQYQADIIKAQIFKNLLGSSFWLLAGLAITTFSLYFASKEGGTYYIFYWAILIGGWQMLKGLWIYFTRDRKIIKQLKIQNRTELLTNIMSNG